MTSSCKWKSIHLSETCGASPYSLFLANIQSSATKECWCSFSTRVAKTVLQIKYVHPKNEHEKHGLHDDVINWKHFPRYWPFVWGICAWINGWVNNGEAGDLRRHRAHYDVIVMENEMSGSVSSNDWAPNVRESKNPKVWEIFCLKKCLSKT